MPRPDLTPSDLRPGQRVRITKERDGDTWVYEGTVSFACPEFFLVYGHGQFTLDPDKYVSDPSRRFTQTIEVIE